MLGGRAEEAVRWADEALAPAGGTSPTAALRAAVLVNKGSAFMMIVGREDEGERLLLEGLAGTTSAEDYVSALRAVHNLAHPVFPLWDPDRSAALLDQMDELIGRSGRQDWTGTLRVLRATFLAHVLGDLTAARAELAPVTPATHKWWASLLGAELALEADLPTADALLGAVEAGRNRISVDDADLPGKVLAFRVRLAARRGLVEVIDVLAEELAVEMLAGLWHNADAWHHALVAALHSGWPATRGRELLERVGLPEGGNGRVADPGWKDHAAGALAEAEGRLA
jgi:hypothetical protein